MLRNISILLLVVAGTLLVPSAASAADASPDGAVCSPQGSVTYVTTNVVSPNKLTHHERYYNGTGQPMTTLFQATYATTLTAGITVTAGGSVKASEIISSLAVNAGVSLAASGSQTSSVSVGISATLPSGKYLVAYRGNVFVKGNFTKYTCNGSLVVSATGTGQSFSTAETGAQRCDLAAPSGSLAALAKNTYC